MQRTLAGATRTADPGPARLPPVAIVDLVAKLILLGLLVRLALDPEWGNLEGKAPLQRAVVYPCVGLLVPLLHRFTGRERPYPWLPDLFVTMTGFTDVLGNRLDLYDRIAWFDDVAHLVCTGLLAAAVVLLSRDRLLSAWACVDRAVAAGLTLSLAWEVWAYQAFVTRSGEHATAYVDTVGDLALGWTGALFAGAVIAMGSRRGSSAGRLRARR